MGNTHKSEIGATREGISDLNRAVIMQTNDVTRPCRLCLRTFARKKCHGIAYPNIFAESDVFHFHTLLILTRTNPHKSDSVPMFWVHICLNFEHKTRKLTAIRVNYASTGISRQRRWRKFNKAFQHLLHSKIS